MTTSMRQSRCGRPSIGPLPLGLKAVDPSPLTSSYSTSTDPARNSRLSWTEPALSAARGPHRSCSRAWRRIYSTCSPAPTSTRSRVAPIRSAAACTWIRRAHKIGIGAGWAPVATRPKCERSESVSGPPNRGSPASARAGRSGSSLQVRVAPALVGGLAGSDVVIEREFVRGGMQVVRRQLVVAFVVDPGRDQVGRENASLGEVFVVLVQAVDHRGQLGRSLRDIRGLFRRQVVEVLVDRGRRFDLVLDAVQAG